MGNNAGQVAFNADLRSGGFPVGAGVFAGGAGSLTPVAMSGDQAPGTPAGADFTAFGSPALNDSGRAAFVGALWPGSGGVISQVNDQGIWSQSPGGLALVARAGSQAPGTPQGVTFASNFFPPALNNAGQTVFSAALVGGVDDFDAGIWSKDSSGLVLVARSGTPAVGTPVGVNYTQLYGAVPVLNDAGQIAFSAKLTGSGVDSTNDGGIWLGPANNLALIVRSGSHAPGTPAGVNFTSLGYFAPSLNAAGQIAFLGLLTGSGVDDTNWAGIWATDPRGDIQLIARYGDLLEVAPGDFRTIAELGVADGSGGGGDGGAGGFNDLGQIAYWARFTDGSDGVFVSSLAAVPEPGGLALLGLALPALLGRFCRRRSQGRECCGRANATSKPGES